MNDFGDLLRRLIAAKYDGQRAFIRVAQPDSDEGSAQAYLSKTIRGLVPAPLSALSAWADALDLRGADRDRFMDMAVKSHANDAVLAMIGRLEREASNLRKDRDEVRAQLGEILAELAKRGINLGKTGRD